MNPLPLITILLFAAALPAAARADAKLATERAPDPQPLPPSQGFMWTATRDGRSVHLMGTIHIGRSAELALPAPMMRRLRESASIAIEADVSNPIAVMTVIQKYAFYPDDHPGIRDRIAPETREAVARVLGAAPDAVWRNKPWFLANTVMMVDLMGKGHQPAFGTEALLIDFARKNGKPVTEIEGLERQIRIFDSAPEALQLDYLRDVLESIENGEADREMQSILDAWDQGDFAAIERLCETMVADDSDGARFVIEKLFDERHPDMIEAIERLASSGEPHTVAVGVLHFAGPNGLLSLLRERGFKIVRVPPGAARP